MQFPLENYHNSSLKCEADSVEKESNINCSGGYTEKNLFLSILKNLMNRFDSAKLENGKHSYSKVMCRKR